MTAEPYIAAHQLAERMGVSVRTIRRWTAEGMPSETWGMTRTRRYLSSQAIAWAHDRATVGSDNAPAATRAKARRG